MIKVLFLDVDGVVNCRKTSNENGWPIDPFMAFLVARIVDKTGCKIVLSSSWRHSVDARFVVRKRVMPFIDITPQSKKFEPDDFARGHEIASWLRANTDVTKYAILDDFDEFLPDQKPNFFKTSIEFGLTQEIADQVINHLN